MHGPVQRPPTMGEVTPAVLTMDESWSQARLTSAKEPRQDGAGQHSAFSQEEQLGHPRISVRQTRRGLPVEYHRVRE